MMWLAWIESQNTKWSYITKLGRNYRLAVPRLNRSEGSCICREKTWRKTTSCREEINPIQTNLNQRNHQSMTQWPICLRLIQIRYYGQLNKMLGLRRKSVRPTLGRVWSEVETPWNTPTASPSSHRAWLMIRHPLQWKTWHEYHPNNQTTPMIFQLFQVFSKLIIIHFINSCEQEYHLHLGHLGHLIEAASITSRISKLQRASVIHGVLLSHVDPNTATWPAKAAKTLRELCQLYPTVLSNEWKGDRSGQIRIIH